MTYSLDLDFVRRKKTDLAGPPRAHIYVKTHVSDSRNLIFISHDCVTLRELEYEIERLKKELEDIRKKAKRKFSSTK